MEEQGTQLSDTRPWLDSPLLISIPANIPNRLLRSTNDEEIYKTTYSPFAIAETRRFKNEVAQAGLNALPSINDGKINLSSQLYLSELLSSVVPISNNSLTSKSAASISSTSNLNSLTFINIDEETAIKNSIKDYELLSISSSRNGKKDVEAMAYASLGVLYENNKNYLVAISYYKKYLKLCQELNDSFGISAAYNSLGVCNMLLANENLTNSFDFAENISLKIKHFYQSQLSFLDKDKNNINEKFNPSSTTSSLNPSNTLKSTQNKLNETLSSTTGTNLPLDPTQAPKLKNTCQINGVILTINPTHYYLLQALEAHENHLKNSPDLGGKFVANINIGLTLNYLNTFPQLDDTTQVKAFTCLPGYEMFLPANREKSIDFNKDKENYVNPFKLKEQINQKINENNSNFYLKNAAKHFQDALRIAIKMQTLYGQSVAVGNLGKLALYKRDFITARTCFDQNLQLVQALLDSHAEINAWKLVSFTIIFYFFFNLIFLFFSLLNFALLKVNITTHMKI